MWFSGNGGSGDERWPLLAPRGRALTAQRDGREKEPAFQSLSGKFTVYSGQEEGVPGHHALHCRLDRKCLKPALGHEHLTWRRASTLPLFLTA